MPVQDLRLEGVLLQGYMVAKSGYHWNFKLD